MTPFSKDNPWVYTAIHYRTRLGHFGKPTTNRSDFRSTECRFEIVCIPRRLLFYFDENNTYVTSRMRDTLPFLRTRKAFFVFIAHACPKSRVYTFGPLTIVRDFTMANYVCVVVRRPPYGLEKRSELFLAPTFVDSNRSSDTYTTVGRSVDGSKRLNIWFYDTCAVSVRIRLHQM